MPKEYWNYDEYENEWGLYIISLFQIILIKIEIKTISKL